MRGLKSINLTLTLTLLPKQEKEIKCSLCQFSVYYRISKHSKGAEMKRMDRRDFFKTTMGFAGLSLIMPIISACETKTNSENVQLPMEKPKKWNPIEFNRLRRNSGAIPQSYLPAINGPDGEKKHLGKHLPYIPKLNPEIVIPAGYIPIMWGDSSKGYTPHPNAVPGPDNNFLGHWYNRIEIRKAISVYAESMTSNYSGWPKNKDQNQGLYISATGGDLSNENGIHTVYLAKLPSDVKKGDTVRILAHCLTHGEYVDFITL